MPAQLSCTSVGKPKALLIGVRSLQSSYLAKHLERKGCECRFATSYPQACSHLSNEPFDMVFSPTMLRRISGYRLIDLLEGTRVTLFYSYAVEQGCWWLPALRQGEKCFGSSALRVNEFVSVLDELIAQIRPDQQESLHPVRARSGLAPAGRIANA